MWSVGKMIFTPARSARPPFPVPCPTPLPERPLVLCHYCLSDSAGLLLCEVSGKLSSRPPALPVPLPPAMPNACAVCVCSIVSLSDGACVVLVNMCTPFVSLGFGVCINHLWYALVRACPCTCVRVLIFVFFSVFVDVCRQVLHQDEGPVRRIGRGRNRVRARPNE